MLSLVCCYDIADDSRRMRVSEILEALGPRVQFSVFEAQIANRKTLDRLLAELRAVADPVEDQIRIYLLGSRPASPRIIGSRTIEEWRDYWIV